MTLPDLRHRGDDILVLAEHFLLQFCSQIGRKVPDFKTQLSKLYSLTHGQEIFVN